MNRITLITTRDVYPFEFELLKCFEVIENVDFYEECIKPLDIVTSSDLPEQTQTGKTNVDVRIKKRAIGHLYKDDNAPWTKNENSEIGRTFNEVKKSGALLLKRTIEKDVYYILPCTGTERLNPASDDPAQKAAALRLLRQKYTSNCINLICKLEHISRNNIYAFIHSLDTGITSGSGESCVVKKGECIKDSPLEDIANAGHLFLFHHTSGQTGFKDIVQPICSSIETPQIGEQVFARLFPSDVVGWWEKMSSINDKEY